MHPFAQKTVDYVSKPEPWVALSKTLLWLASLFIAAQLVWLWVEAIIVNDNNNAIPVALKTPSESQSSQISMSSVINKHLFGDVSQQPVVEVVEQQDDVATTDLNLTLRGIYASDDEGKANAIIEVQGGNQNVYFIGESLEGVPNAKLHQVYADKIILNRSGKLESLTLEQSEMAFSMTPDEPSREVIKMDGPRSKPSNVVNNPRVKDELEKFRGRLQTDPASLSGLLRMEPVMENGVLQGVKISPGKERRLFYDLQLKRNDVVTSINGSPLSDPSQLLLLQQSLAEASEINLSILRNGQPQDITIKLNDRK